MRAVSAKHGGDSMSEFKVKPMCLGFSLSDLFYD